MKQRFEEPDYADLKREVEALRKKIEDTECGRIRPKNAAQAARWGWLSRKRALVSTGVIVVALLVVLGLGAQNKASSLFVDENGKVGINTIEPKQTLDVNGESLFRQPVTVDALTVTNNATIGKQLRAPANGMLNVVGPTNMVGTTTINDDLKLGNSDVYFTKTDHKRSATGNAVGWAAIENSSDYTSLMILGRMNEDAQKNKKRDTTMWDRVAIAKTNPQAPLDVKGEIRGKPWYSKEYEWTQGKPPVVMTRVDRTVCFLTLVSGLFYGNGEVVDIETPNQVAGAPKRWVLFGKSGQRDVRAKARCIGVPDDETW
jgi:hypothetical protein